MSGCKDCQDCTCKDDGDTLDEPLPVRYVQGGACLEPDAGKVSAPTDEFAVGDTVLVAGDDWKQVQGEVVAKTYRYLKVRLETGVIRLFEPRMVERIVIAFLLLLLAACGPYGSVDYGRLEDPNGVGMCPIVLPLVVLAEDGDLYREVQAASDWWNDETFPSVSFCPLLETAEVYGVVTVGYASLPDWQGGEADVAWRCYGGVCEITGADVTIQTGLDAGLLQPVLRHELGHCLGLDDDDPGLGSIMQSPSVPEGGDLTDQDRTILLEGCE